MPQAPIQQECPTCRGHGLLPSRALAADEALLCPQCDGKGWIEARIKPFTGLKPTEGIRRVHLSRSGTPRLGSEDLGTNMSYEQFVERFTR